MLPYRSIESVESVDTPLSPEMANALDNWYKLYTNRAPWLGDSVKSLNLPAFISSELARQILLELKWNITGKNGDTNKRAEYLKAEFEKTILPKEESRLLFSRSGVISSSNRVVGTTFFHTSDPSSSTKATPVLSFPGSAAMIMAGRPFFLLSRRWQEVPGSIRPLRQ